MGKWFTKYFSGAEYEVTGYDTEITNFGKKYFSIRITSGSNFKSRLCLYCVHQQERTPEIIRLIAKEMKKRNISY